MAFLYTGRRGIWPLKRPPPRQGEQGRSLPCWIQSTDDKEQDDSGDIEESNAQTSENIESEMPTEELFDLFISFG